MVIDRQLTRPVRAGGLALNPRSLERLEQVGILPACLDQSIPLEGTRLFAGAGRSRYIPLDFEAAHPSRSNAAVRILTQPVLESELLRRARELGLFVQGGISFSGVSTDPESGLANVSLLTSQGVEMQMTCRVVVGCDGPYSSVRQAAGIKFPGRTLDWIYSIGEFEVSWDLPPNEMYEFLGTEHLLVALPLPTPGRYRLTTWEPAPPTCNPERVEHGPLVSPPTLLDFQDVVNEVVPFPTLLNAADNLHCFRVGRRLAERFRLGPVCLAGDAAHAFPPATALGMNLGIEDAFVLASKIASGGDDLMLESYHTERYQANLHALLQTESAMMELSSIVLESDREDRDAQDILMERWSPHERFLFHGSQT